jgi:predicted nucleic acid-binding protein
MRFVIDASVALRWYLSGETHEAAERVLERVLREPELFAVPELFLFEVFAVLTRMHPRPLSTFTESFLPVVESGVFRHPMTAGLADKTGRFTDLGLTGYDAVYAGLAAELGGHWLTFDEQAHERIREERVSCALQQGFPSTW